MGLGLLLCAYFLFTFMSVAIGEFAVVTYLVGVFAASAAIEKLKAYNPRFRWLWAALPLYILIALFYAVSMLDNAFLWGLPIHSALVTQLVSWAQFVAELAYSVIALWSLAELAWSVGLEKQRARAWRNLIFVGFWAVAQLLLLAIPSLAAAGNQALVKVLLLYQLVVYFLNTLLHYSCFSAICPDGEEFGKPSKPSRFKFINDINRKLDEKNERARLEYEAKMAEENKKYSAKNNNRHHKKKK